MAKCHKCRKETNSKHKQHQEKIWCLACWKKDYILRAITIPVAGPVNGTWEDLRAALQEAWQDVTQMANWMITELVKRDVVRTPDMKKLPPMPPKLSLYKDAVKAFPNVATKTVCSMEQAIKGQYAKKYRFDLLWRRCCSPPTFDYPFPLPVHNQSWAPVLVPFSTSKVEDGEPTEHLDEDSWHEACQCPGVSLPIGKHRWILRLRGGKEFGRQLAAFRQMLPAWGEAKWGELTLYRVKVHNNSNRNGMKDKVPGGGQTGHTRFMCKMVGYFPRKKQTTDSTLTMLVKTDPAAFCVAEIDGRRPFIVNADHVRRWIASHKVYLQRISEDTKYEKRYPKRERLLINQAREKRCLKQKARIDTAIKQIAAILAKYAKRNKVCEVIFDDSCRDYLPSFPWFQFGTRLTQKLDAEGIQVTKVTHEESECA